MTDKRTTQVLTEQWAQTTAPAQITQVVLEQWASVATVAAPAVRKPIVFVVS